MVNFFFTIILFFIENRRNFYIKSENEKFLGNHMSLLFRIHALTSYQTKNRKLRKGNFWENFSILYSAIKVFPKKFKKY